MLRLKPFPGSVRTALVDIIVIICIFSNLRDINRLQRAFERDKKIVPNFQNTHFSSHLYRFISLLCPLVCKIMAIYGFFIPEVKYE